MPTSKPSQTRAPKRSARKSLPKKSGAKAVLIVSVLGGGALALLGLLAGFLDGYGQVNRARKADALVVLGAQVRAYGAPVARAQWKAQPARAFYWALREALLVVRDGCLRRV
jgi:hypothetical protein